MRHKPKDYLGRERRRYIRLDSVFPVEFRLLSLDGKRTLSELLQGFTNNISKGGICLCMNNLNEALANMLIAKQAKMALDIHMPLSGREVTAVASVAWMKKTDAAGRFLIGLSYEEIDGAENNKLMRYAWMKKLFVPATLSVIIFLGVAFSAGSFINAKLIKGNIAMVEQLVKIAQESSIAKQKIKEINSTIAQGETI